MREKCWVSLLLLILTHQAEGQQASTLTVELVDQRIASLQAGGAAETNEALATYKQVQTLLNQADSHTRDAAAYVEALASSPQREAEIQQRLDELDETYDPGRETAGLTPDEMNARLALARTEQRDVNGRFESLDRRLAARETNASGIRARLAEISQQSSALPDEVLTVNPSALPSLLEANQWRNAAEGMALSAEERAKEAQLASQPVRYSAMAAERAELATTLERLVKLVRVLEASVTGRVQDTFDLDALGIEATDPAYELAVELASRDAKLREERVILNDTLTDVRRQNEAIGRQERALEERYATARRIVDFAGDSEALGRVLLTYWNEIGDFSVAAPIDRLSREVGGAVIRRIEHEEVLASLVSSSGFVSRMLREAGLEPESTSTSTRGALQELARGYRERLRAIIAAESEYIDALSALESGYSALTNQSRRYRDYLEGLVLWIPNHPPLWTISPASILGELRYVAAAAATIEFSVGPEAFLALVLTLVLLFYRGRLVAYQQTMNRNISRPRDDSVRFTVLALGAVALRAMPFPILLVGVANVFDSAASPASQGMSNVFSVTAVVLFSFGLMRLVSEPAGIGRGHFAWGTDADADRVHHELTFLIRWWLPVAVLASVTNVLSPDTGEEAMGRLVMLVAILVIGYRVGNTQIQELRASGRAWFSSTQNRLRALLTAIFLTLLVAVIYGRVFSVLVITESLINTLWVGIGLLLVHGLLIRWLRVARRRLRLNELLAQRAQQGASEEGGGIAEEVPDLGDISSETQQLVNVSAVATALAVLFVIWEPLLPAFDALGRVNLWASTTLIEGETITNQITLATVLIVVVLAALTVFAARRLPALVEIALRSRTSTSPGARYAVSSLLNYTIIGTGIVAGLSALGLQWAQLQWLVAALGVGIGFGLQEIVANFISGLIILFERPIRVGDIVTVGDNDGVVTRIRIRATTIRDFDGKELLVPNKEFITQRLLNWSLSDAMIRLVINVGVVYGSDVEKAMQILSEIANEHPKVVDDPESTVVFTLFGDNSLNLALRCFIASVDDRMPVTTDLHREINNRFNDAGLVIAFPQRDVHLDSAQPIRISLEGTVPGGSDAS